MFADTRRSESSNKMGMGQAYDQLFKTAKERKLCTACNRSTNAEEMVTNHLPFEIVPPCQALKV